MHVYTYSMYVWIDCVSDKIWGSFPTDTCLGFSRYSRCCHLLNLTLLTCKDKIHHKNIEKIRTQEEGSRVPARKGAPSRTCPAGTSPRRREKVSSCVRGTRAACGRCLAVVAQADKDKYLLGMLVRREWKSLHFWFWDLYCWLLPAAASSTEQHRKTRREQSPSSWTFWRVRDTSPEDPLWTVPPVPRRTPSF